MVLPKENAAADLIDNYTMQLIKAFHYFALLSGFPAAASASILTAVPAAGNSILNDIDGNVGFDNPIEVVSNVPVNINKYFGDGGFLSAVGSAKPLSNGDVKVLVTSNCDTSQHNFAANVDIDSTNGKITVQVGEDGVSGEEMPFLTPSSFDAAWTMSDQFCEFEQSQPQTTLATELSVISDGGCAVCKQFIAL